MQNVECAPGCRHFTGGEIKHHKDCPHYPESMSKMYDELKANLNNWRLADPRFNLPSSKQMLDIAILFNDGKLEAEKLAYMLAYGQFIVDRLYENGDIEIPSSKERGA